ncbi:MAG: (deoxy)nucleoside triphosphate pyrophosphohydrolase [Alphaproteobacteria bacterium]
MTCIDVTMPLVTAARPVLLVAAAVLIDADGKLLLTCRPPGKKFAGLWEFPGGKVDAGEAPEQALVRELREELGIATSPGCFTPLTFASHGYDDFHLLMPLYGCRVWQGTPEPREGQGLAWVTKQELRDYDLLPADKPLVPLLHDLL